MPYVAGGSKGCWTCRKRKIACSKERPTCSECRRARKKCEGYEKDPPVETARGEASSSRVDSSALSQTSSQTLRRNEKSAGPSISRHTSPLSSSSDTQTLSPRTATSPQKRKRSLPNIEPSPGPSAKRSTSRLASLYNTGLNYPTSLANPHAPSVSPPQSQRTIVRSSSVSIFSDTQARRNQQRRPPTPIADHDCIFTRFQRSLAGPLLANNHFAFEQMAPLVMARIGAEPALDEAIECISAATAEINSPQGLHQSRVHYSHAVSHLRHALMDEVAVGGSDILCATFILQIYELYTNVDSKTWFAHAWGASRIIEMQGPSDDRDALGKALLESMRATMISVALKKRCSVILADPPWVSLLQRQSYLRSGRDIMDFFPAFAEFTNIVKNISQAPDLLAEVRQVLLADRRQRPQLPTILGDILHYRQQVLDWNKLQLSNVSTSASASAGRVRTSMSPNPSNPSSYSMAYQTVLHLSLILTNCFLDAIIPEGDDNRRSLSKLESTLKVPLKARCIEQNQAISISLKATYAAAQTSSRVTLRFLDFLLDEIVNAADDLPNATGLPVRLARNALAEEV